MEDIAYRRLLDWYYTNEQPISLDVSRAAKLIGMQDYTAEVSEILSNFFLKSEDGYRNKRCDEEIIKYQAKAERAKQANNKRWESKTDLKSDLKSDPNHKPITNNHKPNKTNRSSSDDRFPEFYAAYPKKVKKKPAHDIWKRKKLNALTDKILQDIAMRLSSDRRWLDGFVPDPTTYLNQERWNDEITGDSHAKTQQPRDTRTPLERWEDRLAAGELD